jgi:hypothetical protein
LKSKILKNKKEVYDDLITDFDEKMVKVEISDKKNLM